MKTECSEKPVGFKSLGKREVVARFDGGDVTSDGGGLLLRELDERLGITRAFAACFTDHRNPDLIEPGSGSTIRVLPDHTATIKACIYSPDETRIFSVDTSGALFAWDAESGKALLRMAAAKDIHALGYDQRTNALLARHGFKKKMIRFHALPWQPEPPETEE